MPIQLECNLIIVVFMKFMEGHLRLHPVFAFFTRLGQEVSGEDVASNAMFGPVPSAPVLPMAVQGVCPSSIDGSSSFHNKTTIAPGQTFTTAQAFREALHLYSLANNFEYQFKKNTAMRISACCTVDGCPWKLTGNGVRGTSFMSVGSFIDRHVHAVQDIVGAKPKMYAKYTSLLVESLGREQPNITAGDISAHIQVELGSQLTYMQAWRCKEAVRRKINGNPAESYKLLPWLCERIKDADGDSVTILTCGGNGHNFHQLFVAYGCSIHGFLNGCRPIIFIDACHMKGPYQGTLVSAVSLDADDHMYPLAYAVVDAESSENWGWFLTNLKAHVTKEVEVVIISDRNPSIIASVAQSYGRQRHAYCYRHIKENCSSQTSQYLPRGPKAKKHALDLLDAVVYARLHVDYIRALENLRKHCKEMVAWVEANEPERWVMSKFPHNRWDCITTNVAESFNNWVGALRFLPIYSFINGHRDLLAKKLLHVKTDILKWKNVVGPNIEMKLKENMACGQVICRSYHAYGYHIYKVSVGDADLNVDLSNRACTCRAWEMSGLPCPHACVAIKAVGGNIYDFVDPVFHKSQQEAIYERLVTPVETHNATASHVEPPLTRRPPGRPATIRIESQFIKKRPLRCSSCNSTGHNRRKCKNPHPSPCNSS